MTPKAARIVVDQTGTDGTQPMIETPSLDDLAARIPDGASVAIPPDYSGCAMAAVKALIRRRARDLHIIGVPAGGVQLDWLIGAGCVGRVEAAAVTLGENGLAPRFTAAIKAGAVEMRDATCPAIHAGLQAAEKGIPFMPLRGILGSDLVKHRPDWKVIDNPLSAEPDPLLLIPAIKPDVALFHAAAADRNGNVWIGVRREMMLMAHAAKRTFVTVERIEDADFLRDDNRASGTIPSLYVSAIAVAPGGARPVGLGGEYPADETALADYAKAARTDEGFARWMGENILGAELV
ncbi:MAG: CoA-transferase [Hyphomicrobiaceae bacterium]